MLTPSFAHQSCPAFAASDRLSQIWQSSSDAQDKYYSEKLELRRDDAAARRAVAAEYVRGLRWVLEYYYRRVRRQGLTTR